MIEPEIGRQTTVPEELVTETTTHHEEQSGTASQLEGSKKEVTADETTPEVETILQPTEKRVENMKGTKLHIRMRIF